MALSKGILKKRIIASSIAAVMTLSIVGAVVYMNANEAYAAKATLRGIQELANIHSEGGKDGRSPLIIIEVVNDLSNAKIGYLIGGEEPVTSDARAIKDMPSKAEREDKLGSATPTYLKGDAYTWEDGYNEDSGSKSMEIRGDFYQVDDGTGYYAVTGSEEGYTIYKDAKYDSDADGVEDTSYDENGDEKINAPDELEVLNQKGVTLYRKMYYYNLGDIDSLHYMGSGNDDLPIEDSSINTTDNRSGAYNWQYFSTADTIRAYDQFEAGTRIYQGNSGNQLQYVGTIDSVETGEMDGEEVIAIRRL